MPMAAVSAHPILHSSSRGELLPAGWSVHRSRTHDREYWFNETTGETKWTPPSPPPRESPSPEADLGGSWAGLFSGGSAMGKRWTIGKPADTLSDGLVGYMRFDAENIEDLLELLEDHPIIRGGGTIEICEIPKS